MARIVMLSSFPVYPANDGGRVRIHQLATHLAREHDVTVICPHLAERPHTTAYEIRDIAGNGPRCQLFDPPFLLRLVKLLRREAPDALLLEYVWQGFHAAVASVLAGRPFTIDAFDVVSTRFRRRAHPLWPVIGCYERIVLARAHKVIAISETDRAQFEALGVPHTKLSVVPAGVDIEAFHPDGRARARVRARPRLRAGQRAHPLLRAALLPPEHRGDRCPLPRDPSAPGPGVQIVIAGRGADGAMRRRYEDARVRFLGAVGRIQDYINAADVLAVPLRSGSGTRFKIIETLACGVPIVATAVAAEGIAPAVMEGAITIADDWPSFADAVTRAAALPHSEPNAAFLRQHDWREVIKAVPV